MRRLGRVGALPLSALAIAVFVGPAVLEPVGQRFPIRQRPSDYGLRYEDVSFVPPDRPLTLRGWWIPAEADRGALVFVHGGGDDNRSLPHGGGLSLARELSSRGWSLLMIDLRSYGESDGTPEGITYGELESNDVIGAIDFLSRRGPAVPIGAIGLSNTY